jgi:hypothetical protein
MTQADVGICFGMWANQGDTLGKSTAVFNVCLTMRMMMMVGGE